MQVQFTYPLNSIHRYRRILKSMEENIDLPPSLVPALRPDPEGNASSSSRATSSGEVFKTSPELVMFCNRVYEFRFKRMKNFY